MIRLVIGLLEWPTEAGPTKIANGKLSGKEEGKTKRKSDTRKCKNSCVMDPSTTTVAVGGQIVNKCNSHRSKGSTANCTTNSNSKLSFF